MWKVKAIGFGHTLDSSLQTFNRLSVGNYKSECLYTENVSVNIQSACPTDCQKIFQVFITNMSVKSECLTDFNI